MITVTIKNTKFDVPRHSSINNIFKKIKPDWKETVEYQDNPIVGALVNNELLPLNSEVAFSCPIVPVKLFSSLGKKMYRHSICFLLCCSARSCFPHRNLVIGHSLGDGYYFNFEDDMVVTEKTIETISNKMIELTKEKISITKNYIAYQETVNHFKKLNYKETSLLLSYRNDPLIETYHLGSYYDLSYEPLISNTSVLTNWELRLYGPQGMLLRYPRSSDFTKLEPFHDNPLLFSVFKEYKKWNKILGVQSVGQLNQICYKGNIQDYIRLSESLQAKKIAQIADKIDSRAVKAVFISGPSSSGKTTFAKKLCIQLQILGYEAQKISLDDYYLSGSDIPLDEHGEKDYEAFEALDIALFQENIAHLLSGKSVDLPHFNFKITKRYYKNKPITLNSKSILVIEGIHALNPNLIPTIDKNSVYKIYISALTQLNLDNHNRISTTDNRIIRRIVRDHRTRGTGAYATLTMWPSVQRGENVHIFPHQNNADTMLNSALDYELGVLATFAIPLLKTIKPNGGDAYTTSRRLLSVLDCFYPIPETLVPKDSLIREFIGNGEEED